MKFQNRTFRYAIKRLIQGIPLVLVVVLICYAVIMLAPGDPVTVMCSGYTPTDEYRAVLEEQWGLNDPVYVQMVKYFGRMLSGDLGISYKQSKPVTEVIMERLPNTLLLMLTAIAFSFAVGVMCGVFSARHQYSIMDSIVTGASLIGYSAPLFWVGQILILVFGVKQGWLPVSGMYDLRASYTGFAKALDVAKHLILPALSLSFWFSAMVIRVTRTKMAEVLQADYIKTASAKGLTEGRVVWGHAFRNAMGPLITVLGLELSAVVMGATVIETIFSWPGTGRLMYDAVIGRDYPLIAGMFFFVSTSIIIVNIIIDILYAVIDPQVCYE